MNQAQQTIGDLIDALAAQTGAAETFVDATRASFTARDIPLSSPAEPFFMVLIDTFRREESIRASQARAAEGLARIEGMLNQLAQRNADLARHLRALHERLTRGDAQA